MSEPYSEQEKYAILAEVAYADDKKHLLHDHYGLFDYNIDEELTSQNSSVILTPENEVVISYRGTNVHNPSDLLADVGIFLGLPHVQKQFGRFKEAEEKYQSVKEKYPELEIKTTGHSLGAAQSMRVAREHNIEGHHFNIGSGLPDLLDQMKNVLLCDTVLNCENLRKQNLYTTGKDFISVSHGHRIAKMFGINNVTFVKPKRDIDLINHSLAHFLPLPRNWNTPEIKQMVKEEDPIKFFMYTARDPDNFCNQFPRHPLCKKYVGLR